jgi:hypothetical protein
VCGPKGAICFKDLRSFILSDKWSDDRKANLCNESERILLSASKLIAAQIKDMTCDMSTHLTSDKSMPVPPAT